MNERERCIAVITAKIDKLRAQINDAGLELSEEDLQVKKWMAWELDMLRIDMRAVPPADRGAAAGEGVGRMKIRPILFSAPMVRALLDGRKTQTRRLVKRMWCLDPAEDGQKVIDACPYGRPGDLLWVRETWHKQNGFVQFRADWPESLPSGCKWLPSIHMPRRASRLTLRITGVRVERLQDISEEDAKAEGLKALSRDGGELIKYGIPDRDGLPGDDDYGWHWRYWEADPRQAYFKLWSNIHGDETNLDAWVWVLTFDVIHNNIAKAIRELP